MIESEGEEKQKDSVKHWVVGTWDRRNIFDFFWERCDQNLTPGEQLRKKEERKEVGKSFLRFWGDKVWEMLWEQLWKFGLLSFKLLSPQFAAFSVEKAEISTEKSGLWSKKWCKGWWGREGKNYLVLDQNKAGRGKKKQLKTFKSGEFWGFFLLKKANFSGFFPQQGNDSKDWRQHPISDAWELKKLRNEAGLTASTRARMMGKPKAETTIPVVKK